MDRGFGNALAALDGGRMIGCLSIVLLIGIAIGGAVVWFFSNW